MIFQVCWLLTSRMGRRIVILLVNGVGKLLEAEMLENLYGAKTE